MPRPFDPRNFEMQFYEGIVRERPDYVEALMPLAELYMRKGYYAKGLEIDRRLARLCREDPVVHYNLACSLALTGHTEEAVAELKRAVRLGYRDFDHLRRDPDLRPLHPDPEFQRLLASFRA